MKPRVYPIFIPFVGCSYRCVYCNQYVTTSVRFSESEVVSYITEAMLQHVKTVYKSGHVGEIAFFGGTFTSLPISLMKKCLDRASKWVDRGIFTGIRFSTRPDCLNSDIFKLLSNYPVSTVELGVQSFDQAVLKMSGRFYGPRDVLQSSTKIKECGWKLGIQLMPGLPGDSKEVFMKGLDTVQSIKPDYVRLYPTLVIKNTPLEKWFYKGVYVPLGLKEAIEWCVDAVDVLDAANIEVIRMGLQATEELNSGAVVAGPYHPAFGYLVRVHQWRRKLDKELASFEGLASDVITVMIPDRYISEFIGPSKINIKYWKKRWEIKDILIVKNSEDKIRDVKVIAA